MKSRNDILKIKLRLIKPFSLKKRSPDSLQEPGLCRRKNQFRILFFRSKAAHNQWLISK